jgi:hypothetical protein
MGQCHFLTEPELAGLNTNRRDNARLMWECNLPNWYGDDGTFERSAASSTARQAIEVRRPLLITATLCETRVSRPRASKV